MQKQCEFINSDTQERCKSFALDNGLCFSHNPDTKEAKAEAVFKGGSAPKRVTLQLSPIPIKSSLDVALVLEEIINSIRTGSLSCSNPANTIGFLCGHILKAFEQGDLSKRLEVLEYAYQLKKTK